MGSGVFPSFLFLFTLTHSNGGLIHPYARISQGIDRPSQWCSSGLLLNLSLSTSKRRVSSSNHVLGFLITRAAQGQVGWSSFGCGVIHHCCV